MKTNQAYCSNQRLLLEQNIFPLLNFEKRTHFVSSKYLRNNETQSRKSEKTLTKNGKPLSKTDTGGGKYIGFLKII